MSTGGPAEHRWPLRGRDDARRRLLDAASRLTDGPGGVIEIVADAGAGKSYLLEHVMTELRADGRFDVRSATGRSQQLGPYGCARDLLGVTAVLNSPPGSTMLQAGVEAAAEAVVFDELLAHADRRWSARPSIWVVDDLHLADAGSLAWIRSVASLHPLPVLLILARRAWSAPPILTERQLGEPADRMTFHVMTLAPLTLDDAIELCLHRYGTAPGERLRDLIGDAAGSPLLITSLLELAGRSTADIGDDRAGSRPDGSGRSDRSDRSGQSRWAGEDRSARVELSADLDSAAFGGAPTAIAALVSRAAGDRRFLTAVMAASGGGFDLVDVAGVSGAPLVEVARLVDDLSVSGLVVADDARYRFRHELYRVAATELVSAPMLRSVHAAAARWLIERGEHPLRVVEHLVAGDATGSEAAGWLVDAAEALVTLDPAAALDLTGHASHMSSGDDRRLTMVRARALANIGRPHEAEALIHLLLPGANREERSSLHRDLAMVAFTRAAPHDTAAEFERAAEFCDDERARARLHAESSFAHLLAGDFERARQVAAEGSERGEELGDPVTVIAAEMVGSLVALYRNDVAMATTLAERLEAMSDLPGSEAAIVYQPWFSASLIRRMRCEMDHARRLNATGRARSEEIGLAWMVPAYDALDACCAFDLGALDDCTAAASAALAAGITDSFGAAIWCEAFLARVALARGEPDDAEALIDRARRRIDSTRAQLGWDHVAIASAELATTRGRPGDGFDELVAAWEVFEALGLSSPRQELAVPLARLARRVADDEWSHRVADDCARAADTAQHRLWSLVADETRALRDDDVDALVDVSRRRGDAGHELRCIETLVEAAAVAERTGHRGAAKLVSRSLVEVEHAGVPGVLTPIRSLVTRPVRTPSNLHHQLTKSERTVIELVADGLSNSEIADRLFVSRRTVESHVSSAYRKLGASNRVELARHVLDD